MGRNQRRRRIAITTCVLWLLAVEVLPNVHLAGHRADHTHRADGTIVTTIDHGDHSHQQVQTPRKPAPAQLAIGGVPDGIAHAAAGIAHRAIALHPPQPPLLAPLLVVRAQWHETTEPDDRVSDRHAARPTARGPPVA